MKVTRLEKLTLQEEAQISVIRDEWLNLFYTNKGIDKKTCGEQITWLYNKYLKEQSPYVWYCDSPLMSQLIINILSITKDNLRANLRANLRDNLRANLWDNLWDNLEDNLRANLWDNLGANLGDNLGANLGDNLRANLGDNLRANLMDNLRDNLGANLWDNLEDNLRANLWDNLGANLGDNLGANLGANLRDNLGDNLRANLMDNLRANLRANLMDNLRDNLGFHLPVASWCSISDYGWTSIYDFIERLHYFDFDFTDFDNYKKLLQSGIYEMIPFKNIVFVSTCPIEVYQDENKRLHNIHGPAVRFKDGYEVFAIRGRILPAWIWKQKETITKEKFISESNAEIRAGMYSVLGEKRIMEILGAVEVDKQLVQHQNGDIEILKLFKTTETFFEIGNTPLAWVKFICPSTGTDYLIACEPHHVNAKEAAASLSIFDKSEYSFNYRT